MVAASYVPIYGRMSSFAVIQLSLEVIHAWIGQHTVATYIYKNLLFQL